MLNHNPLFPPEYPMPEHPGAQQQHPALPPVPIIFEGETSEGIPLRVYAAIQLRVPASGIDWLDQMIVRSRELDRVRARAVPKKKRK